VLIDGIPLTVHALDLGELSGLVEDLRLEFPRVEATFADERVLEQGRAFRAAAAFIDSPAVLAKGTALTQVPGLRASFAGAGLRAALDGGLPGWRANGAARAGVLVNLTPEWREPWVDESEPVAARLSLLVGEAGLPERLAFSGGSGPCMALLATLGNGQVPARQPPPNVVLRPGFGSEPGRFSDDLATLSRNVTDAGNWVRDALDREDRESATLLAAIARGLQDTSTALTGDEVGRAARLLERRHALGNAVERAILAHNADLERASVAPHPPVIGPVEITAVEGWWRDRWSSSLVGLTLRPTARVSRLTVRGYVSPELAGRQRLSLTLGSAVHRTGILDGDVRVELPFSCEVGETARLEIRASHQWMPCNEGTSDDKRALAWLLVGLETS
jgi:hypothetical protein